MEEQKKKKEKRRVSKKEILITLYIGLSALFAVPSIVYLLQNHSIYRFIYMYSYTFTKVVYRYEYLFNAFVFIALWIGLSLIYYLLLKYHSHIFKSVKQVYIFIGVVGLLFAIIIPCTSSDVYSYIANRMDRQSL